jgi:hypothetical protein
MLGSSLRAVSAKTTSNKRRTAGSDRDSRASSEQAPEPRASTPDQDVALVCGVSGDGQGVDVIRKRGDRIETGTVRRLEQGKPIHGEVVRLRQRENMPLLYDVEVEMPAPAQTAPASSSGPAQVATDSYRKNWDAIYGRQRKPGELLN